MFDMIIRLWPPDASRVLHPRVLYRRNYDFFCKYRLVSIQIMARSRWMNHERVIAGTWWAARLHQCRPSGILEDSFAPRRRFSISLNGDSFRLQMNPQHRINESINEWINGTAMPQNERLSIALLGADLRFLGDTQRRLENSLRHSCEIISRILHLASFNWVRYRLSFPNDWNKTWREQEKTQTWKHTHRMRLQQLDKDKTTASLVVEVRQRDVSGLSTRHH